MAVFPSRQIVLPQIVNFVNYIQSSGAQYINSEVIGKSGVRVDAKVEWTDTVSDSALIGARSGNTRFNVIHSYENGLGYGYGSWVSASKSISVGTAYEITSTMKSGSQTVVVDGVTVHTATVATTYNTGIPMFIFGSNYGGTFDFKAKAKLYWMKIYENDVLVRDFWPCYDPDGVACLYDKVEKKYYYNAGSGEFIAGEAA